jgi:hypothetical protein
MGINGQQKRDLRVPILISDVDLRLIKHNMQALHRKKINNGLLYLMFALGAGEKY